MLKLLDCRTGGSAAYPTTLEILEREDRLIFRFTAYHAAFFCPYDGYNESHYTGDVCEIFLEVAPNCYYEIELTPRGGLFLARIHWQGRKADGTPIYTLDFVPETDCFVQARTECGADRYTAEIAIPKTQVPPDARFNAFRIETDGGQRDKHLFALSPTLEPRFHNPQAFVALHQYI